MKLESKRYYGKSYDIDNYKSAQIKRHSIKSSKKRKSLFYREVSEVILTSHDVDKQKTMLALGSRNNHERDCFKNYLHCRVFSSDISPASKTDFIIDFNFMPDEWKDKWDIIYSNSIDHTINPTKSYKDWLACLKLGGLLVIGFLEGGVPSSHDCSIFSISNVEAFFKKQENIEILQIKEISGYHHFYLKRVK